MAYSKKTPYLFDEYGTMRSTTMEREIYDPSKPERGESEFKKPYLYEDHPSSERSFTPPGMGPPVKPPWVPPTPGGDCSPQGSAIGGGKVDFCDPSIHCGQWAFTCAHRIISFRAIGGIIANISYSDDTATVTACWDETMSGLSVIGTLKNGNMVTAEFNKGACLGEGHDPKCTNCDNCKAQPLTIGATSQQMLTSGTQALWVASPGGGAPYVWSITSGGGSLAKLYTHSPGETNVYTAPASNNDCSLNPTIKILDYCGKSATLKMAVTNADYKNNTAYIIMTTYGSACEWAIGYAEYSCQNGTLWTGGCDGCSGPTTDPCGGIDCNGPEGEYTCTKTGLQNRAEECTYCWNQYNCRCSPACAEGVYDVRLAAANTHGCNTAPDNSGCCPTAFM